MQQLRSSVLTVLVFSSLLFLSACNQYAPPVSPEAPPTEPRLSTQDLHLAQPGFNGDLNDPNQINFTLEGCRNTGDIVLPNASGDFVCDDSAYTTGNLGKGWNELDLVPHRVSLRNDNGDQSYTFIVAGDYKNSAGTATGWDVVSPLTLNTSLSDAACPDAVVGPLTITPSGGGVGGADQTIYRKVDIVDQPADTTCVYDYYQRLALGASDFSGSSLQSNLWNKRLTSSGIGQKRLSLPVNEILPQELDKTMTASRGTDHRWSIEKMPTPASLNFENTCLGDDARQNDKVTIEVTWTKLAADPSGVVTLETKIYATNPASRVITVNVTDKMYEGTDQSVLLATLNSGDKDVPANTASFLVLTHTAMVESDATTFNDVAVATYIDKETGVAVPGNTTATATAEVQNNGPVTNGSATITDTESITGASLQFSADSFSGALGSFDGYTPGTRTTGPVDWTSATQTDSGSVTFNKTVYVTQPANTSGMLSDTATVTGSDGFTTDATANIAIQASALVELTIKKTIPDILQGDDTASFKFDVSGPDGFEDEVTINFVAGETSKFATLSDLQPGSYTVEEQLVEGFVPAEGFIQNVSIDLPTCAAAVTFTNTVAEDKLARVEVKKVTDPEGEEAGWEMTLAGPGDFTEALTTDDANFKLFNATLNEGAYTVTETEQEGWDKTTSVGDGCDFTVNYPADFGRTFQCTITNVKKGKIIVDKVTIPSDSTQAFEFNPSYADNFFLTDTDAPNDSGLLSASSIADPYSVAEVNIPDGWDLISAECSDGSPVTAIDLDPGEEITCTFTNRQRGMVELLKLTNGLESQTMNWDFTLTGPEVNESDSSPPTTVDFGGVKLIPGEEYTLCEVGIPAGWTLEWSVDTDGDGTADTIIPMVAGVNNDPVDPATGYSRVYDPNYVAPPGTYTNDTRCVNFVVDAGETLNFQIDNQFPGGEPRTIGYWKNWNTCTGGNQAQTAAENGGPAEGWYILDDLLNNPGYTIGVLQLDGADCEDAVNILDKRSIDDRKKRASDAAYGLAAQLFAAQLNLSAGAETCSEVVDAVNAGQTLLADVGFDGTGSYFKGKNGGADRAEANALAATLDAYNNGELCN